MGRRYRSPGPTRTVPASDGCAPGRRALDGDEMPADADDGDAGHATGTYIYAWGIRSPPIASETWSAAGRLIVATNQLGPTTQETPDRTDGLPSRCNMAGSS
jgi:hypothetical protein